MASPRPSDVDLTNSLKQSFPASDPPSGNRTTGAKDAETASCTSRPSATDAVWELEQQLWTGPAETHRRLIADVCLMALPSAPYLYRGDDAVAAVVATPRWLDADLDDRKTSVVTAGTIALAYRVTAHREDRTPYEAHCTTVYVNTGDDWRVVQHQQTPKSSQPPAIAPADAATS